MTITYIGGTKNDFNGTPTAAVTTNSATVNTSAGDLVFLFVKYEGGSTSYTVSDSVGGNSWTQRGSVDHSNGDMHTVMFTSVLSAGGSAHQFTATLGATRTYFFVGAVVYRSTVGWTYFDTASAQGSSAACSAGSKTPTGAYAAVTGFGEYAAVSWTPGSGWTTALTGTSTTTYVERQDAPSGATITGNATPSSSMDWAAIMAVFIESGGGGGSANAYLTMPPMVPPRARR